MRAKIYLPRINADDADMSLLIRVIRENPRLRILLFLVNSRQRGLLYGLSTRRSVGSNRQQTSRGRYRDSRTHQERRLDAESRPDKTEHQRGGKNSYPVRKIV